MPTLPLSTCPEEIDLGAARVGATQAPDGQAASVMAAPSVVMAPASTTRRIILPVSDARGGQLDWDGLPGPLVARILVADPSRCGPACFDGVLDPATSLATVPFDPAEADPPLRPGIYDAELVILDPESGRPAFSSPFFLSVEPSLAEGLYTPGRSSPGPITVAEMRMMLRDADPGQSRLLERLIFSDVEIVMALRRAVDQWNDEPPVAPGLRRTPQSFPDRSRWADGARAWLYQQLGEHYHRNNLAYSAAGVTVDDTNKFEFYARAGAQLERDYLGWVRMTKTALNREFIYGTVSGGFGRTGWYY